MLQEAAEESDALSVGEFMSVLRGLTDAQWLRLHEIGRFHSKACGSPEEDLINEAIFRVTEGRRNCPRNVDPIAFLSETMRSISHGLRQKARRLLPIDHKTTDKNGKSVPFNPADASPTAEHALGTAETTKAIRAAILSLFSDDTVARDFAEGVMEGLDGEELRAYTGISGTAFSSMRKKFRRRVDAAYPNGWIL
ncbi:RNA polymerase subunit sigma-24 [Devosia sp.]|uniref:RNA polymerase subunit sigma-24 n=1 Tax=Devosia sp. TaxID=1871048 RepID=UPI0035B44DF5